jgi:uncharacterized membrane protein YhhN
MLLYIAILFTIAGVVTAVLQFWPKTSIGQEQPFLFPVVTMIAINIVALLAPDPVNLMYKGAILLGLLLSTLAVVFFYLPDTPVYVAVAHFFVIHFLYFIGFAFANRAAVPSPIILLVAAYAVLIYWMVKDQVKEQRGALIGYIVVMAFMVWAASEVWVQHQQLWAAAAFAGAILLVMSASALLADRTRTPIKWGGAIIAYTFYAGQLLIAWSIWGFGMLRT